MWPPWRFWRRSDDHANPDPVADGGSQGLLDSIEERVVLTTGVWRVLPGLRAGTPKRNALIVVGYALLFSLLLDPVLRLLG